MQFARHHSRHAVCVACSEPIPADHPCIRLRTEYFYRGCRSFFIHVPCVDSFVRQLKKVQVETAVKYLAWKLENGKEE